ncbi:hypothetical protein [Polymorphum gilvum]|uniref:Uncharacterized protein n=1 Tax=Polymorphum gilvum (strain LMG 25793 / CGMCC 1.9160 / SL003B-26A1) TaxID=991905 RepID=F2J0U3_POLGS|nr:hypothetical protein [Polymorphum gilvum]ADZ70779.1 hypothetical protein SL003B_2354 [Polymorphum gilvum SL003B-26A1]
MARNRSFRNGGPCALALAGFLLAGAGARADDLADFARTIPDEVLQSGVIRLAAAPDYRFVLLRLAAADRLFVQKLTKAGDVDTSTEIEEIMTMARRVGDITGEVDSEGLIAFVEFAAGDGDPETYELFMSERSDPPYLFQPASN